MRTCVLAMLMVVAGCFHEEDGNGGDANGSDTTGSTGSMTASTLTTEPTGMPTTEPTTEPTGDTTSAADTTTGDEECPFGSVRVPPIPAGWEGVDIITSLPSDAPAPSCPLQLDRTPQQLGPQIVPEAACDCECTTDVDELCSMDIQQAFTCDGIDDVPSAPLGTECVANTSPAVRLTATGKLINPIEQPRYVGDVLFACVGPPDLGCAPRPAEFFGPCVHKSAETECPDDYPMPFTTWTTACNDCIVPNTNTFCGMLHFDVFTSRSCDTESFGYFPQGQCVDDDTQHSGRVSSPQQLDCGVTTGEPQSTLVCCVAE